MDKALIDSDVLLDFFLVRQPFSEYAAQVLSLCDTRQIQGFLTPVICSNIYYVLRQISSHEIVIKRLNNLMSLTGILIIDRDVIIQALSSSFKDFEDAIQNYSAENSGFVNLILTRNIKDYKYSSLSVMTPEIYIKARIARNG